VALRICLGRERSSYRVRTVKLVTIIVSTGALRSGIAQHLLNDSRFSSSLKPSGLLQIFPCYRIAILFAHSAGSELGLDRVSLNLLLGGDRA